MKKILYLYLLISVFFCFEIFARSLVLKPYSDQWGQDAFGNVEKNSIILKNSDPVHLFLGPALEKGVHPCFDSRKGTLEFFFKLNEDHKVSKVAGLPIVIPFKKTASSKHKGFIHLNYKNGILMYAHSDVERRLGYLGPWKNYTGPLDITPHRWYHFAIEWELNRGGKFYGRAYLDGKRLKGDKGRGAAIEVKDLVGIIRFTTRQNISIDELRISNACRYRTREFKVPDKAFEIDEHCLALYHFDGHRNNEVVHEKVFKDNAIEVYEKKYVRKILPLNCKLLRGFTGFPIDGTVYSYVTNSTISEYPNHEKVGSVHYEDNPGSRLEVNFKNQEDIDYITIWGGASVNLECNQESYRFPGNSFFQTYRRNIQEKLKTVTFKTPGHVPRDASVGDLGFYREVKGRKGAVSFFKPSRLIAKAESMSPLGTVLESISHRYGSDGIYETEPGNQGGAFQISRFKPTHLLYKSDKEKTGLDKIQLSFRSDQEDFVLTVSVFDPVCPNRTIDQLSFWIKGSGEKEIGIDFYDQILPKGKEFHIMLKSTKAVQFDKFKIGYSFIPVEKALDEALEWRMLLIKTFYSAFAENRPWAHLNRGESTESFLTKETKYKRYSYHLRELFDSIDYAWWLSPSDSRVNQYRDWIYLNRLEKISKVSPPAPAPKGQPLWAVRVRQAWLEARRVASWWVENRMTANGEFGCNLGDDSVLYTRFSDLPFFERSKFTDKMMTGAVALLERAEKNNLEHGINKKYTDTLHAYEEGMNLRAILARWFYGNPIYLERCMESQRSMEKLTIFSSSKGRHLPQGYLCSEDLKKPRKPKIDSSMNCILWHTGMVVADYNRNPQALKVVGEWVDSFAKKMKPGRWVTSINPMTGSVAGFNKKRPLIGGAASQGSLFLWLYKLTGDPLYVNPLMHFYKKGKIPLPADMYFGDFISSGAHKLLSEKELDRLSQKGNRTAFAPLYLREDVSSLIKVITGSVRLHTAQIDSLWDAKRWPDMTTTAEPSADRVLLGRILNFASQAYLGGVNGRNRFTSTHAVSWEGFGTDYAALVLKNQKDYLKIALYNFSPRLLRGDVTLWALQHGKYNFKQGQDTNGDFKFEGNVKVMRVELERGKKIPISLTPGVVTILEFEQVKRLNPVWDRPDLAIVPSEIFLNEENQTIEGTVHNIGAKSAKNIEIALFDMNGALIASEVISELKAPLDLKPSVATFKFKLKKRVGKMRLEVDPNYKIIEIYKMNNLLELN